MLAFSAGSASKLRPAKRALSLVKTPHIPPNFLPQKRVTFVPQEFAICPDVGLRANRPGLTMATSLRQQVQRPGGAYVEDQNSRFHATGNPNHGCNECCTRTDSDRQRRATDLAQPNAPRFTRIQETVMAKVIEFYIPTNFRKPLRRSPQPQLGKIIEFCSQTKRSA